MPTRGCVAVGTIDSWKGVYNHSDSYPTGLGKEIWGLLKNKYKGDVKAFEKDMLEKKSWRALIDDKFKNAIDDVMTEKEADPLFIEWVYIINPKDSTLSIMAHKYDSNFAGKEPTDKVKVEKGGWWNYGHIRCKHDLLIKIDVNGKEPDWVALEKMKD